ncbi:hypothetical protein BDZ97DRAFT_1762675 [Flammula alnicola]|nr:hypothetical protein BDZ97DRAFT_1762675 [Flammula alnicola]
MRKTNISAPMKGVLYIIYPFWPLISSFVQCRPPVASDSRRAMQAAERLAIKSNTRSARLERRIISPDFSDVEIVDEVAAVEPSTPKKTHNPSRKSRRAASSSMASDIDMCDSPRDYRSIRSEHRDKKSRTLLARLSKQLAALKFWELV